MIYDLPDGWHQLEMKSLMSFTKYVYVQDGIAIAVDGFPPDNYNPNSTHPLPFEIQFS